MVEKKPFGLRFTGPLMLGTTLNPLNSSLIATGLAGIAADFSLGPGTAATLVSVLYLCSAVMQPTMGKLATLFGPRRIFLTGVAILLVGGALGGLAVNFGMLLVSRALIGVGTSACYPAAMALVRRRADRLGTGVPSRVLGDFSIAAQVTVVLGLPVGGVLAGAFGWRGLFWVNVPLAAVTLVSAFFAVEKDEPRSRTRAAIDLPGIALFAGAVVVLLLFLGGLAHPVWWQLAVAVVLVAALLLWERRATAPLIDVRMLAGNGPLQRTYLRQLVVGLGVYTSLYATSQWMQEAGGYSASASGLLLLPMSLLSIVLARVTSARGWVRLPLTAGAAAVIAAGALMLDVHRGSPVPVLIALSGLFGVTNGLSNFANQATLYARSPGDTIAVAAGLFRTAGYIGAIFSSSLIGITFGGQVTDAGFHRLALLVLGIGVVSTLLAGLDRTIPVRAGSRP
ncbi:MULTISPECIES: MFS transporter [Amycolatopsis]|uniref:Predicted arabinose efflux permease, MFS family n=2 Tax=Amycolatopsis TaxID=1813 RepID=A0A1I3NH16_9PSEU|nr:MFS transporter [Amycolatopsis sacchari]SFJ08648.1 Predicted arabinose efflux permease, MFS family [Amycolatopsis sacchari]